MIESRPGAKAGLDESTNAMLLFYCAAGKDLAGIRRRGLSAPDGQAVRLWTSLAAAQRACEGRLLVLDAGALPQAALRDDEAAGAVQVRAAVPPRAFRNLAPYRPPQPVTAAGGYVARAGRGEPEVLLIFRRGVWDLPKGKLDAGETLEACALREVREELGIEALRLLHDLGTTTHDYVEQGRYRVKTTHWFLMQTPATRFRPEAREGIEAVAWMPWREARRRLGYDSLRRHMQRVEAAVREALAAEDAPPAPP